jgi:hypothetical protein
MVIRAEERPMRRKVGLITLAVNCRLRRILETEGDLPLGHRM